MQAASEQTGLSFMNIRIGQLCGGVNGAWTAKEWLPIMVQSATVLGSLPTQDKVVYTTCECEPSSDISLYSLSRGFKYMWLLRL
jgi:thioester reductase-like protein